MLTKRELEIALLSLRHDLVRALGILIVASFGLATALVIYVLRVMP